MVKPIYAFKYCNDICVAVSEMDINCRSLSDLIEVGSSLFVYRYKGKLDLNLNLEVCSKLELKYKYLRSKDKLLYFLKILYPDMHMNPISLCGGHVVLDNPYIEIDSNKFCIWNPIFEDKVSMRYIQHDDKCMVYHYQEPIFIFTYDYKRHTPALNEEYFSLNYVTGTAVHTVKEATTYSYTESSSHFDGKMWIQDMYSQIPITGRKKR